MMSTDKGIEVKKDGLSQLQDGSWVLKLKVHPEDMPTSLMTAPMGTRYIAAMVEIGDDEQPVGKKHSTRSQRSAMMASDQHFQNFLMAEKGLLIGQGISLSDSMAGVVRIVCNVDSRAEFDSDPEAAKRWDALLTEFEVWKRE